MDNIEKLKEIKDKTEQKNNGDESSVKLIDVLICAAEFLADPQNEEKEAAFEDIKKKTVVSMFLPLKKKSLIVDKIIKDIQEADSDIYDFGSAVEIAFTFDGLLAYTNIDQNISIILKDYECYDVLWASGYCDMLLEYCQKDYDRLIAIFDRLIEYHNVGELMDAFDSVNYKTIEELNKNINGLKLDINPDTIHDLATIVASQDETVKEISDIINASALSISQIKDKE